MKISDRHYRAIWRGEDRTVRVIDQSRLPFAFEIRSLDSVESAAQAIRNMVVRGAPLIGATAAYGVALAMQANASTDHLETAIGLLRATRPTAIDLAWALERMQGHSQVWPFGIERRRPGSLPRRSAKTMWSSAGRSVRTG